MAHIQRRKARAGGALVTYYEVWNYYGGEILTECKTKKEAKEFCKANNLKEEENT